jgi:hypothetical protein
MRHRSALLSLVALLLISPRARADEVQVPLDQKGQVQQVDAARARAAGVLTEYPRLKEARLYQDTDSGDFTLEVTRAWRTRR